ncbi:hypothetical protein CDL15_Pgr015742 [Punica granatum]|uniref:glucan endo-1,3-beta-D-glucosidase n=1 Tax=Punica granatum TaxID=22663 RepID=A0A218XPZ5_PUNGR|nr:hypothetical protein CDL15_Pgr015742 [Punica granatum]
MAAADLSERGFNLLLRLLVLVIRLQASRAAPYPIGVNYGTVADNLPPPAQVAAFLKSSTTIDRVKIFDANPDILRAFASTGIAVTVTVGNGDIIPLADLPAAQSWVASNILPFHPATNINRITVGNEIHATHDNTLISRLLPALKSLHSALELANVTGVEVTTPHSLGILSASEPPSTGLFRRGYDRAIFAPILEFHRQTKSSFMVNPYPYFGFTAKTLDYALFRPNPGVFDPATGINYTNMFDAQMDAVYTAMKRLGYSDVAISIGETGWPSVGDPATQPDVNVENAQSYNGNLVRHVNSGKGTPLMPNRTFETYIFSLFNEDLKPTVAEQNFGLFKPDLTPVYDVGILRDHQAAGPAPSSPRPSNTPLAAPSPSKAAKLWCVPESGVSNKVLQPNIDYACSKVDCSAILPGGPCFNPDTVQSHAAYAMNAYYQAFGQHTDNCSFGNTAMVMERVLIHTIRSR